MNITDGNDIKFQRCHRLGKYIPDKGLRDVIVRSLWYEDRDKIWQCKTKLKNSGIVVNEDFSMIIEQHRSKLYPLFRAAKEKNLKPLLIADSERKNSERKKKLLRTWTLYHLICSLRWPIGIISNIFLVFLFTQLFLFVYATFFFVYATFFCLFTQLFFSRPVVQLDQVCNVIRHYKLDLYCTRLQLWSREEMFCLLCKNRAPVVYCHK